MILRLANSWVFQFLIAVSLVLGAVWITTRHLESEMDVRFYDESYYLTQGIFKPIRSWEADYSPLYSLYYKALSWFEPRPVELYYLNYRVWATVFGTFCFLILRAFGAGFWLASFWAVASLSASVCLPLWPKAGHMAMAGVSTSLLLCKCFGYRHNVSLLLGSFFCFALSWVRPEFFAGGIAALGLLIATLVKSDLKIREGKTHALDYGIPILLFASACIFLILWGLPVGRSGRGMVAFGQHFVHNWHTITHRKINLLYDWVNWRQVLDEVFGQHDSLIQAIHERPMAIIQHLWFNIKYLFLNAFTLFFETLVPFRIFHISIGLLVTIALVVCEWFHQFNGISNWWKGTMVQLKTKGILLIPIALPSLLAGLLFQPRPHYILPLFPFFLALMARLSREYTFPLLPTLWKKACGVGCLGLLLWATPPTQAFFKITSEKPTASDSKQLEDFFTPVTARSLSNKELITKVQKWNWLKNRNVFDGSTGVLDYYPSLNRLGKIGFEFDYETLFPLDSFLQKKHVEVVYLASSLQYDYAFSQNEFWQKLKAHPKLLGWQKIAVPASTDSLLVRSGLPLPPLN